MRSRPVWGQYGMDQQILKLLERKDYAPANVPELLRHLGLRASQQQELQLALAVLEKDGKIVRTKGNRYIQSREADLVPGTRGESRVFCQVSIPIVQPFVVRRFVVRPSQVGRIQFSIPARLAFLGFPRYFP